MNKHINTVQGAGLALLTRLASSDLLDQLKLRKLVERGLYQGSKNGFRALSQTQKVLRNKSTAQPRERLPAQDKSLFDLNLTPEQQMTRDMLQAYALEVLRPMAATADDKAMFNREALAEQLESLTYMALPENYGGVAAEQSVVSNVLIAEDLARGDFALAAALLSQFSVINALTRWGNAAIQSQYLKVFSEQDLTASFATQENTPAFNPLHLQTKAQRDGDHYRITGEKTLVILGEHADVLLVSAQLEDKPEVFVVERDASISVQQCAAMGLKACETVNLRFDETPAHRLGDDDFDYQGFIDLGSLMWGALAVGTCEAVKAYCIDYANDRTAFGKPISHRQSVAFMIADMAIEIDAMRLLIWNAASLAESGKPFHREAYLARLLCAEKSMKIGTDGVQILGGHGFTKEYPVERWYRDLRATAILYGGLHA